MKHKLLLLAFLTATAAVQAQNVGINTTGARPDTSTILDLNTGNNGHAGFLPEQVALTTASDASTIFMPAKGLFVYNTGAGGLTPAGYYYNSGSPGSPLWVQLLSGGAPVTSWNLIGNAGTSPTTNFIGTTDAQSLEFGVNGIEAGWIDYNNGNNNTFFGYMSGNQNTTGGGSNNTAVGYQALISNTNNGNTAVGYQALTASTAVNNTAVGSSALAADVGGYNNTAFGASSLQSLVNGNANTSLGMQSSMNTSTGSWNTVEGYAALITNTSGSNNTAIGGQALQGNNNGVDNTAIGMEALWTGAAGSGNTALGCMAGYNNTAGMNVFIGDSAGYLNSTGINNTYIGYQAGPTSANTFSNCTYIGYQAGTTAPMIANSIVLGNSSIAHIYAQVDLTILSDKRVKDSIQENVPGLAFITKLRPVTYNFNVRRENEFSGVKDDRNWSGKNNIEKIKQTGFIAQEVDQAAKECGYNFCGVSKPTTPNGLYGLGYSYFVVPLVKAVQEQQKTIDSLKTANNAISKEEKDLKTANATLQTAEAKNEKDIAELRKLVYILTEKAEATETKK